MPTLVVNGTERSYDGDPDMPLLWYLRDELGLTGTKFGCGIGPVRRLHRAPRRRGRALLPDADVGRRRQARSPPSKGCRRTATHPVQVAWRELNVPQCGYCQAGQIMQAAALLKDTPKPDRRRRSTTAMGGNICRCGTYPRIRAAIKQAATREPGHDDTTASCSRTSAAAAFLGGVAAGVARPRRSALPGAAGAQETEVRRRRHAATAGATTRSVFVAIAPDGTVTVTCHRSEMGQGVRTSVADGGRRRARGRLVARSASCRRRATKRATATRTPTARASLRHFFMPLRRAGAAARADARTRPRRASGACRSPRSRRPNHAVVHAASEAARSATARSPPPRRSCRCPARETAEAEGPGVEFRYIGKDKMSGSSTTATSPPARRSSASTRALDGMLYAVVARPPVSAAR